MGKCITIQVVSTLDRWIGRGGTQKASILCCDHFIDDDFTRFFADPELPEESKLLLYALQQQAVLVRRIRLACSI